MRVMMLVVLVAAGASFAGKKTLVVGAGDCKDGALLSGIKDFHDDARPLLKGDLLEADTVLRAVRPQASRSIDDIQRQVETARSLLYGGQNERGLELVQDALTELERASPQVKPWALTVNALLLQAQMLKNLDRVKESSDAFRRVLRVEATYKLDPDSYPPSTVQAFEAVRKELTRGRKGTLQVTSTPAGALVFVDGREVGKTPLKLDLPQGSYRVSLMAGEAVSFPRKVNLVGKDEPLVVDMAFEGAVSQQAPICVSAADDSVAIKLASIVAADQVVIVRNMGTHGNPTYLTGTLYEGGRGEKVRNAGVRPEQLKELMLYLFTGKPDLPPTPVDAKAESARGIVTVQKNEPSSRVFVEKTAEEKKVEEKKAEEKKPEVLTPKPSEVADLTPPPPPPAAPAPANVGRVMSFVSLGVGAAALVTGIIIFAMGGPDRDSLAAITSTNGRYLDTSVAQRLMTSIDSNRTTAFTVMGLGAGAAIAGLIGVALFPATSPMAPHVALAPTLGGVSLSGRF